MGLGFRVQGFCVVQSKCGGPCCQIRHQNSMLSLYAACSFAHARVPIGAYHCLPN